MTTEINIIADKNAEFDLVQAYLDKLIKGKSAQKLKNFHGVKLNRKRPIKVNGKLYQLNHSFILVYDEIEKQVKPFLLTPGKPRNEEESGLLGSGGFGIVKRVEDQDGKKLALKIIDEENYYNEQLKIAAAQLNQQCADRGRSIQFDEKTIPSISKFMVFKAVKKILSTLFKNEVEVLKHAGMRHAAFKRSYSGLGLFKRFTLWLFGWNNYKSYILMPLIPGKPLVKLDAQKFANDIQAMLDVFVYPNKLPIVRADIFGDGPRSIMLKPTLSDDQKLSSALQLAEKFADLHAKGWAILDIKGENILHDIQEGKSIVNPIDYGCCERIGKMLNVQTVRGTQLYMAPELLKFSQIAIERGILEAQKYQVKVTDKLDVYSLGVVFKFELRLEQSFGAEVKTLIDRMMSDHPAQRPTMAEVHESLRQLGLDNGIDMPASLTAIDDTAPAAKRSYSM